MQNDSFNSLLTLVRNSIFSLSLPVAIDEEVVSMARKHSIPQFVTDKGKYYQIARSLRQENLFKLICTAFEKAQIEYMPLKGSVVKYLYPELWMRSSGDIDILIHKSDMSRVSELLCNELGMEFVREGSHCFEFCQNNLSVEVHYRLLDKVMYPKVVEILGDGWKCAIPDSGCRYRLSPEVFYLYHLTHMAVDILNGGCGIRPFIDVYIILHNMDIERDRLNPLLVSTDLLEFESVVRNIAESWMAGVFRGTDLELFIVNGGIYGRSGNGSAMKQARYGGKRAALIKRLFLTYDEMVYRYPSIENKPFLLPLYWIRYWFKIVRSGMLKEGRQMIHDTLVVNDQEYREAVAILHQFGL